VIRDDIVSAGVIAVGSSATAFALVFMVKLGVNQEPLFALVGALIGAAATVGGAAWLAGHNRNIERDAEVGLLIREYSKLLRQALAAKEFEPDTGLPWPEEYRPKLAKLAETAGNVHVIADVALKHGKALSFIHRAALQRVQFAINEYLQFWTDVHSEGELKPWDERSFPFATADIINECKIAIAELNGAIPIAD
jgi:hypothetical protein